MFGKHLLLWTLWFFGARLNECDNELSGGSKEDDFFIGYFSAKSGETISFYIEDSIREKNTEYERKKILKANLLSGSATLDFFEGPLDGGDGEPYKTIHLEPGDCRVIHLYKDRSGPDTTKRIEMTCMEPGDYCKLEILDRYIFWDYSIF